MRPIEILSKPWASAAAGMVRPEKAWSCSCSTSFSESGDDTTTVLERWVRDLWGLQPSWWMFPMIGNGYGPGGRFWRRRNWDLARIDTITAIKSERAMFLLF
ncbi:hypothetical protein SASPL_157708 [Salvia splendens]|uniref:Uncharacterized protein n=1 Tax=Salvia splendens TaxID=180675 RepID=A0A8X8VUJ2_SALSN|nr:hypothetical protein SASPL_157708 [Salvia splendens]